MEDNTNECISNSSGSEKSVIFGIRDKINSSSKFQELDVADIDVDFLSSKKFFLDEHDIDRKNETQSINIRQFLQKKYIVSLLAFIFVFSIAIVFLIYNMQDENSDDLPVIKAESVQFKGKKDINQRKTSSQKVYSYITNEKTEDKVSLAGTTDEDTFVVNNSQKARGTIDHTPLYNQDSNAANRRRLRQEMVSSIIDNDSVDNKLDHGHIDNNYEYAEDTSNLKIKPKKSLKHFFKRKSKDPENKNINGGVFIPSLFFNAELDAYKYYDYISRVCPFVKQYGYKIIKLSSRSVDKLGNIQSANTGSNINSEKATKSEYKDNSKAYNIVRYKILIGPFSDIETADSVANAMIERGVQLIW